MWSVTSLWYHFILFFIDHYNIIFLFLSMMSYLIIYLQYSTIFYHSVLILCYYCTIYSHSFIMGSFLGLFCPLLIVSSTYTNNTQDVYTLGPYDLKYQAQLLQLSDSSLNLLARVSSTNLKWVFFLTSSSLYCCLCIWLELAITISIWCEIMRYGIIDKNRIWCHNNQQRMVWNDTIMMLKQPNKAS